ncbi:hypothetical protein M1437_02910 [Patescibacteria group bacterium]|nr:hypothetical protein [Patescibacteria group bacterium]
MNQKGFALFYLLIILAIAGFVFIKYSPFIKQINTSWQIVDPQIPEKQQTQATDSAQINQAELEKYLTVEAALLGVSNNISLSFTDLDHNTRDNYFLR